MAAGKAIINYESCIETNARLECHYGLFRVIPAKAEIQRSIASAAGVFLFFYI